MEWCFYNQCRVTSLALRHNMSMWYLNVVFTCNYLPKHVNQISLIWFNIYWHVTTNYYFYSALISHENMYCIIIRQLVLQYNVYLCTMNVARFNHISVTCDRISIIYLHLVFDISRCASLFISKDMSLSFSCNKTMKQWQAIGAQCWSAQHLTHEKTWTVMLWTRRKGSHRSTIILHHFWEMCAPCNVFQRWEGVG